MARGIRWYKEQWPKTKEGTKRLNNVSAKARTNIRIPRKRGLEATSLDTKETHLIKNEIWVVQIVLATAKGDQDCLFVLVKNK